VNRKDLKLPATQMRYGITLLLSCALLLLSCGRNNNAGFQEILPIFTEHTQYVSMGKVAHPYFVSLAKVEGRLLAANYQDVMDLDGPNTRKLTPELSDGSRISAWAPTGLFWHRETELLYVASYPHNNVLWFKVRGDSLVLEGQITHRSLVSPESVFVKGDRLVIGSYDSHSVSVFNLLDGSFLWSQDTPNAHSGTIVGDYVVGTSLGDRSISVWSLATGELINRRVSRGWEPGSFLWPVATVPGPSDDTVLISDAHNGMIQEFTVPDLAFRYVVGRNGPGKERWNMPYGLLFEGDTLYVASTYSGQIMELSWPNLEVKKVRYADGLYRNSSVEELRQVCGSSPALGENYDDYTLQRPVSVAGEVFYPGYKQLVGRGGDSLWISPYWYFVHSIDTIAGPLFFASTSTKKARLYESRSSFREIELPSTDCWPLCGNMLACPQGAVTLQAP